MLKSCFALENTQNCNLAPLSDDFIFEQQSRREHVRFQPAFVLCTTVNYLTSSC